MTVKAGTTLTAAHLSHTTQGVQLTNDSAAATSTWEQWGTETITISDPGIAVEVSAGLTGRFRNVVDLNSGARSRVGISLDGGSSFTYGNAPWGEVGTDVPEFAIAAASHTVDGTPSGDIVIRAEFRVLSTDTDVRDGMIQATMIPAG
ncbi:hypothetical protein [Haloechinothrix salitolerans]|uniref:Uncharacterized protein n=1 Tax=Haloechinothrix salitolerans TaxID=926830 RepID=A0ABW2BZ03_9PSEU